MSGLKPAKKSCKHWVLQLFLFILHSGLWSKLKNMDNIKIRLDLIDKAYTLLSGRHFSSKEEKTKLVACVIDNIVELTKQLNINKEKQN